MPSCSDGVGIATVKAAKRERTKMIGWNCIVVGGVDEGVGAAATSLGKSVLSGISKEMLTLRSRRGC